MKGLSDGNLMRLWRKAVLKKNMNRCFICGNTDTDIIDCHHIVKRRHKILRYDFRNGVPVCRIGCHNRLDSIAGLKMLESMRPFDIIHVKEFENMTYKDYLQKHEMTNTEFLQQKKKELEDIIKYEYN